MLRQEPWSRSLIIYLSALALWKKAVEMKTSSSYPGYQGTLWRTLTSDTKTVSTTLTPLDGKQFNRWLPNLILPNHPIVNTLSIWLHQVLVTVNQVMETVFWEPASTVPSTTWIVMGQIRFLSTVLTKVSCTKPLLFLREKYMVFHVTRVRTFTTGGLTHPLTQSHPC